jgi:hypothetical protein
MDWREKKVFNIDNNEYIKVLNSAPSNPIGFKYAFEISLLLLKDEPFY